MTTLRRSVVGSAVCICMLSVALVAHDAASATKDVPRTGFKRSDTGRAISARQIEKSATETGVLARMPKGGSFRFYGALIEAPAPSTTYLAVSSEYLIVATLDGRTLTEGIEAEAGQVVLRRADEESLELYDFDIDSFLASVSLVVDRSVQASLDAARRRQERLIWWGLLEPVRLNVQAIGTPRLENARRDYLTRPAVVRIRQEASGDLEAMARLAAERFVDALAARETEVVRDLLSPTLFAAEGRKAPEWMGLRHAFAQSLVAGSLPGILRGAVVGDGSFGTGFPVRAPGRRGYYVTVERFDAMVFVTAVEAVK